MADTDIKKSKRYEIDMINGPLLPKMWLYALPLMASGILQLAFNAADMVVVGNFCGDNSLAAVGANSSLINLLINIFIGMSVGTNVLVAHYFGAGKEKEVSETVHTSILCSIIFGVILSFIGWFFSKPILILMGTPDDVLDLAVLYIRVYFLGMPGFLLYNFGSAVLRAIGDTRRPLYFLFTAGVLNVLLNVFFIVVCHMDVDGVALATIISQLVSAVLIVICLMRCTGCYRLDLKELKIYPDKLLGMIKVGLPAGIQGSLFSFSNVLIQSSVNSFGSTVMAGNTASMNLEGFVYNAMNSFYQTSISFTGQNFGAKKLDRINKICIYSILSVSVVGMFMGSMFYLFRYPLLGMYTKDPQVVEYAIIRLRIICLSYFLCGIMDSMVGCLRGLGKSITPMIVSLMGACAFRILWLMTVFKIHPTLETIYVSYPISWIITPTVHIICFIIVKKNIDKKYGRAN